MTRWTKPALSLQPAVTPPASDEFVDALGLQWQANLDGPWWSLTDLPGTLRLFPQPLPEGASNLWQVAALLVPLP